MEGEDRRRRKMKEGNELYLSVDLQRQSRS